MAFCLLGERSTYMEIGTGIVCLICVYLIIVTRPDEDQVSGDEYAAPPAGTLTLGVCMLLFSLPLMSF